MVVGAGTVCILIRQCLDSASPIKVLLSRPSRGHARDQHGFLTDFDAHRLCIDSVLVGVILRHPEGLIQLVRAEFLCYSWKL